MLFLLPILMHGATMVLHLALHKIASGVGKCHHELAKGILHKLFGNMTEETLKSLLGDFESPSKMIQAMGFYILKKLKENIGKIKVKVQESAQEGEDTVKEDFEHWIIENVVKKLNNLGWEENPEDLEKIAKKIEENFQNGTQLLTKHDIFNCGNNADKVVDTIHEKVYDMFHKFYDHDPESTLGKLKDFKDKMGDDFQNIEDKFKGYMEHHFPRVYKAMNMAIKDNVHNAEKFVADKVRKLFTRSDPTEEHKNAENVKSLALTHDDASRMGTNLNTNLEKLCENELRNIICDEKLSPKDMFDNLNDDDIGEKCKPILLQLEENKIQEICQVASHSRDLSMAATGLFVGSLLQSPGSAATSLAALLLFVLLAIAIARMCSGKSKARRDEDVQDMKQDKQQSKSKQVNETEAV